MFSKIKACQSYSLMSSSICNLWLRPRPQSLHAPSWTQKMSSLTRTVQDVVIDKSDAFWTDACRSWWISKPAPHWGCVIYTRSNVLHLWRWGATVLILCNELQVFDVLETLKWTQYIIPEELSKHRFDQIHKFAICIHLLHFVSKLWISWVRLHLKQLVSIVLDALNQVLHRILQTNVTDRTSSSRTMLLVFIVSLFSMLSNRSSLLRPLWVAQPWLVTVSTGIWRPRAMEEWLLSDFPNVSFFKSSTRSNAPPRSQQWQIDSHLDTSRSSTGFQVARPPNGQVSKGNNAIKTEQAQTSQNDGESKRTNGKTIHPKPFDLTGSFSRS